MQNSALTTGLQMIWSVVCISTTSMGSDYLRVWAICGNRSRMFGLGVASGVEHTLVAKGDRNVIFRWGI